MTKRIKVIKCILIPVIISYSVGTIIFMTMLIITRIYNNEYLIPINIKAPLSAILLWLELICFLISIIYYITHIWIKNLYNKKIILVFIINNIIFLVFFYFDIFSLFLFFMG